MNAVEKIGLLPPAPGNPRNSEGSIIQLKDGTLCLVYSHFTGTYSGDNAPAYLAERVSADCGISWSGSDRIIVEKEGDENVMSVSLLRLSSGGILMGYLVKNSLTDCSFNVRRSDDEGKTWGARLPVTKEKGYFVVNNDRLIQLSGGRLVVPASLHPTLEEGKNEHRRRGEVYVFYSDDEGRSWKMSPQKIESPEPDGPAHRSGLQEPGVVELGDGSILLWARTDLGSQYVSRSRDAGITWSEPGSSSLASPCSPASIRRVPSTGDLLAVYNDHSGSFPFEEGKRTPLVAAVSADGGLTWEKHRVIEDDPSGWYCYTSITFPEGCGERAVLSYCAGNESIGKLSPLQVSLVDIGWLYS